MTSRAPMLITNQNRDDFREREQIFVGDREEGVNRNTTPHPTCTNRTVAQALQTKVELNGGSAGAQFDHPCPGCSRP